MLKKNGFLMIVVAILLVVIAGLAVSFTSMMTSGANSTSSAISANAAYSLAYTGIERGLYDVSVSASNCVSSWSSIYTVNNQGEYQYKCTSYNATNSLSTSITNTATTIPLNSVTGFANIGSIQIDSEVIYYDGISGNQLINARRGKKGTSAAAHATSASVTQSQYIIQSQAGFPSLSLPFGKVVLSQAALLTSTMYFIAGRNTSSNYAAILGYNGTWSTPLTTTVKYTFWGISTYSNSGKAVAVDTRGNSFNYNSLISVYNSNTWSAPSNGVNKFAYDAISCDQSISPTICWIAGQYNVGGNKNGIYLTNQTISYSGIADANNNSFNSISCNGGYCVAVGTSGAYVFPTTAQVSDLPGTLGSIGASNGVHCPASRNCLVTQNSGRLYYYNGSTWTLTTVSGIGNLFGVSCPTTTTCFVAGASGTILKCTLPGVSCVKQSVSPSLDLSDVNCISTTDCLAVSATSSNTAYKYNGTTWTAITIPGGPFSLNAISNATGTGVAKTVLENF